MGFPKPFFRSSCKKWYIQIGKRQFALAPKKKEADRLARQLLVQELGKPSDVVNSDLRTIEVCDLFIAHLVNEGWRLRGYTKVHVICDNATFHRSRKVLDYLQQWGHRVVLHFLPRYAPETNPIERVWWRMHEELTRNHRCKTIDELLDNVSAWIEAGNCFYDSDLANYATAA